ncbi:MAG TPA: hypothetical protein VGC75_01150 [Candidatus Nitrosocosmicus sp.]|jgi:hypothetical protein
MLPKLRKLAILVPVTLSTPPPVDAPLLALVLIVEVVTILLLPEGNNDPAIIADATTAIIAKIAIKSNLGILWI